MFYIFFYFINKIQYVNTTEIKKNNIFKEIKPIFFYNNIFYKFYYIQRIC